MSARRLQPGVRVRIVGSEYGAEMEGRLGEIVEILPGAPFPLLVNVPGWKFGGGARAPFLAKELLHSPDPVTDPRWHTSGPMPKSERPEHREWR